MRKLKIIIILFLFVDFTLSAYMKKSMSYHGMRLKSDVSEFFLTEVSAKKYNERFFAVNFKFNIVINPQSVLPENIFVDSLPLPRDCSIVYNKVGNLLRIILPLETIKNECFSMKINHIQSFNDIEIPEIYIQKVFDGYSASFSNEGEWRE